MLGARVFAGCGYLLAPLLGSCKLGAVGKDVSCGDTLPGRCCGVWSVPELIPVVVGSRGLSVGVCRV